MIIIILIQKASHILNYISSIINHDIQNQLNNIVKKNINYNSSLHTISTLLIFIPRKMSLKFYVLCFHIVI